jgi:hypothetical protein
MFFLVKLLLLFALIQIDLVVGGGYVLYPKSRVSYCRPSFTNLCEHIENFKFPSNLEVQNPTIQLDKLNWELLNELDIYLENGVCDGGNYRFNQNSLDNLNNVEVIPYPEQGHIDVVWCVHSMDLNLPYFWHFLISEENPTVNRITWSNVTVIATIATDHVHISSDYRCPTPGTTTGYQVFFQIPLPNRLTVGQPFTLISILEPLFEDEKMFSLSCTDLELISIVTTSTPPTSTAQAASSPPTPPPTAIIIPTPATPMSTVSITYGC